MSNIETTGDIFTGTQGDDTYDGHENADTFILTQGGNDTATGEGGNDTFLLGHSLNADDTIDGGTGTDTVNLHGNYFGLHSLHLGPATITNVEKLVFQSGNYNVVTDDGNVAAGQTLVVDGSGLAHGDLMTFDASADIDGRYTFFGGAGIYDLTGGGAGDVFSFGASFRNYDHVDGGGAVDHVILNGNYTGHRALTLGVDAMASIQVIALHGGHSYDITAANGAFGTETAPTTFVCTGFTENDTFTLDHSAETLVRDRVFAGEGTYHLRTGSTADRLAFGGSFTADDTVNGGGGQDTLALNSDFLVARLNADYTGDNALHFGNQIRSIEILGLKGGYNYDITMADANVASGHTMTIEANGFTIGGGIIDTDNSGFGVHDRLTFDGSAETDGTYIIDAGAGRYHLIAGGGDDTFNFGNKFLSSDRIDGGGGDDVLNVTGNYGSANHHLDFDAALTSIETLTLGGGHNYQVHMGDANVAAGQTMTIDASGLQAGDELTFDGSAETDGNFLINCGAGADTIAISAAAPYSTIRGFNFDTDKIQLLGTESITTVDTVTSGTVISGTLEDDLVALFGTGTANELGINGAVLFTPDTGDLKDHTFLIIDGDGVAGYTAGHDYLIDITYTGTMDTTDFIHH